MTNDQPIEDTYRQRIWRQFRHHRAGMAGLLLLSVFLLIAIYAPLLASSRPLLVIWGDQLFFPLFRYLFYRGFYTKPLDLFFNLAIFTFPIALALLLWRSRWQRPLLALLVLLHLSLFGYLLLFPLTNPATRVRSGSSPIESSEAGQRGEAGCSWSWSCRLEQMNDYAQLNLLLERRNQKLHHEQLMGQIGLAYLQSRERQWLEAKVDELRTHYRDEGIPEEELPSSEELGRELLKGASADQLLEEVALPTQWALMRYNDAQLRKRLMGQLQSDLPNLEKNAEARLHWYREQDEWIKTQEEKLSLILMPLLRPFHWEEDAGGSQSLNGLVPWLELTRINRKDLLAALLFGVRISLVIGFIAVSLSLAIAIPIGAVAGYYGGKVDVIICRLLEIWETMPSFLMLLMVVAIAQSKSIFLIIAVIALFGWTSFSRYIRAEFLRQRHLPYVEACYSLGFPTRRILFNHILPNAIPPLLTLLPFAIMGAVTSEAGLSFLGLGEEGSCSWGVLMNEGRVAFPGESYLLWPPAMALTLLLIAVALVGDGLRDAVDPKLHK